MNPDLIFQYDVKILKRVVMALKDASYSRIQFFPLKYSRMGFLRDPSNLLNILNILGKREHRLFGSSSVPGVFERCLGETSHILFRACFLNDPLPREKMSRLFGDELIEAALRTHLLIDGAGDLRFTLSFVPVGEYIFVRDPYGVYGVNQASFPDLVWMGSDTISFVSFLGQFLPQQGRFHSALEIGSGTGAPIIAASRFAESCLAVDFNRRAVACTHINSQINDISNLTVRLSDMWQNIDGSFDLIIANPWYCDLKTGGLEEIPGIAAGLNQHLAEPGVCLMVLNSYIKNGRDTMVDFLGDFVKRERYDLDLEVVLYDLDTRPAHVLREAGIGHTIFYNAVLRKPGAGRVTRRDRPFFAKMKNLAYLNLRQALGTG